jgi:protein-S-isoprenylcysteine O-methyltransferase Ste14
MLSVPFVQICAGVALAATAVGIGMGILRRPAGAVPVRVVARTIPARGTLLLWIAGTMLAIFWPVGVFLAPTYAYHWPALPDYTGSWAVQIAGVFMAAAGGILYSRAARTLGRQMTPAIQVRQGHELIQSGPYRYIRHPVYTAVIAIALGQTLLFQSLPLVGLTMVLVGLALYRARLEERLLSSPAGFGGAYSSYAARTGRFLPRLNAGP